MELDITKDEEHIIPRREIEANVTFDGKTPSREKIKEKVNAHTDVDKDLLLIKKIDTGFGTNEAVVTAIQYENTDALEKIEYDYLKDKNTFEEEDSDE